MATKKTKLAAQAASPSTLAPAVAKIASLDKSVVYVVGFYENRWFDTMAKADGTPAEFTTEQEAWDFLGAELKDFDKKYKAAAGK